MRLLKSLRARIAGAVFIMVCLMLISGGVAFYYFSTLNQAVTNQAKEELPTLQILNSTQLNLTRLATLSNEVSNSNSSAYSRILLSQVREQVEELQASLDKLSSNNEQIQHLQKIVSNVEPSVANISRSKNMLDEVESALHQRIDETMSFSINLAKVIARKDVDEAVGPLVMFLSALHTTEHMYEQNRIVANIERQLKVIESVEPQLFRDIHALTYAPKGVFALMKQREVHRTEVAGLSTQNRILLGNLVDFGQRVYMDMEEDVAEQASLMADNVDTFMDVLALVFILQVAVAISLFVFLKKQLFSRLQALVGIVSKQKSITQDDVAYFDEQNELGIMVKQLHGYVTTIESQQSQIEATSQQLQSIIEHSQMKIAVIREEQVLYCSDALKEMFADRSLDLLCHFPDDLYRKIEALLSEQNLYNSGLFWHADLKRWFNLAKDSVLWEKKQASLIFFNDVTDQVKAEQEFQRTLSIVESEAKLDPLTGLYNRKLFESQIALSKANQDEQPFAIMVFDVDYFKQYNDEYGHLQGDNILKLVATVIKRHTPSNGYAIRYGGEEFLVYLPEFSKSAAAEIAQTIVEDIYQQAVPHPTSLHHYISVSCGISAQSQDSKAVLDVFEQADKSLYKAKNSGRNCVMVWHEMHQA